jgi:hypothetical protein
MTACDNAVTGKSLRPVSGIRSGIFRKLKVNKTGCASDPATKIYCQLLI